MERLSAAQTFKKILLAEQRYQDDHGAKAVERFRVSRHGVRNASGRATLRQSFVDELADEAYALGWLLLYMEAPNEFVVLPEVLAKRWHRTSLQRVKDLTTAEQIDAEFGTYFPESENSAILDQPD